jgi:hypothetical protein
MPTSVAKMTTCRMSALRHRVDDVGRKEVEQRLDERLRLSDRLARVGQRQPSPGLTMCAIARPMASARVVAISK